MKYIPAVITADMVNSTQFSHEETRLWLESLLAGIRDDKTFNWLLKPEIYRGDSFQGVLKNAEDSMRLAILIRARMRSRAAGADLRVAIGIGKIESLTDRPGTSDGEAFRLSGHLADHIRHQKARIGIALAVPSEPLSAALDLLETLIESWTTSQSEVVAALATGKNITQIAEQLSISQSAVSQRVASSKWWAIENFIATFPKQLSLYTKR